MKRISFFCCLFFLFCQIALNGQITDVVSTKGAETNPEPRTMVAGIDSGWEGGFDLIRIPSSLDESLQKAYYYQAKSRIPRPLIVSLHTWSGDYKQSDPLARLCREKDYHYIHPDFRGPNQTQASCCSDLVIRDIEDAIRYATDQSPVPPSAVYLVGLSGGGYATLCMLMRSEISINKFSAWVPVTDLVAWYRESTIRGNQYARDVLMCTGSEQELDRIAAEARSPIFWDSPVEKLDTVKVSVFTGVFDGITGSVPITHAINFYNKLVSDLGGDRVYQVGNGEKLELLEMREPLGEFGTIRDRKVFLHKQYRDIKLVVFEGGHEMLPEYALEELLSE
jgi:pimeloyl-ACP methyl ester carboxylesterase